MIVVVGRVQSTRKLTRTKLTFERETFTSPPINVNRPYPCPFPLQNFNSNSRKLSHPSSPPPTPEECTRFSALSKLLHDQFNHSYLNYLATPNAFNQFHYKKNLSISHTWWGLERNSASTGNVNNQLTYSTFTQHCRLVDADDILWPLLTSHRNLGVVCG